jgi:hypothetical protein
MADKGSWHEHRLYSRSCLYPKHHFAQATYHSHHFLFDNTIHHPICPPNIPTMASFCNPYRDSDTFIPHANDGDWRIYYSMYPWTTTAYICMPTAETPFANSQCMPTLQPSSEETRTYSTTSSPFISHGISPGSDSSSVWSCHTDTQNDVYEPSGKPQQSRQYNPFFNEVPDFIGDNNALGRRSIPEDETQAPRSAYVLRHPSLLINLAF